MGRAEEIRKMEIDFTNPRHVLMLTLSMALASIIVGIISDHVGVLGVTIIIAMFINIAPQAILVYRKYRRLKEMEETFPTFLRDLTENIRSGMAFHKAIMVVSRNDYGVLSGEVRKMAHQISWGMPLDKVLIKFSERVRSSKRLNTSVNIIKESFASGGEVVSTLESVADSATTLEEADKEKKALLDQYVILMYAISVIFVIIISVINSFLVPIFQTATGATGNIAEGTLSLENPCGSAQPGIEEAICGFYRIVESVVAVSPATGEPVDPTTITSYYTALFFLMALMQSILSGLVAGQISEGSIMAGAKHSIILAGITVGAFFIMVYMGFLGI
jgi:flagellar protein FlaJ